jgi:hypothetical protein
MSCLVVRLFSTPYPRLRGILNVTRLLNSDKIIYNRGSPNVPLCALAISAAAEGDLGGGETPM